MIDWKDPDKWGTWEECLWEPERNDKMWACVLPKGHSGPHVAYLSMESNPTSESYVSGAWVSVWEAPRSCATCTNFGFGYHHRTHPGYRHATRDDDTFIAPDENDNWGPEKNTEFPYGPEVYIDRFVPTFVDKPFPTPPKFNTVEEVEAWLEANPP